MILGSVGHSKPLNYPRITFCLGRSSWRMLLPVSRTRFLFELLPVQEDVQSIRSHYWPTRDLIYRPCVRPRYFSKKEIVVFTLAKVDKSATRMCNETVCFEGFVSNWLRAGRGPVSAT